MSWFSDAVDAVSDAVEDAANAVGEVVSDAVETVGHAVEDAVDSVVGDVPVLGDVLGWVGGIVSDALDLVGAVVKGAFGIVGGVIGGAIRIVGGILSLDRDLILEGLGDIGSSIAGGVLLIGGKAVSLIQSIILVEARERKLTEEEIQLLKRVFQQSVAYYNVRLVEGRAGLYNIGSNAFTLGNTIYLKDYDVSEKRELLVHECTHVWQYQHVGARYTSDALAAQRFVDGAYSWEKEVKRGNDQWVSFNKEAQASFLDDIYTRGKLITNGVTETDDGVFYDADERNGVGSFLSDDHTDRANTAVAVVRGAASQRLSSFVE